MDSHLQGCVTTVMNSILIAACTEAYIRRYYRTCNRSSANIAIPPLHGSNPHVNKDPFGHFNF